ncbi:galactosylceramide sulfotransferase-like [Pomacea canaliculata]|uniref:galactosylceramide sulfotransferase-like n=1 Tax=Pomacea canaliculata TaxID=400727 RepID=UPI000D731D6D|nr:galactosylceramide sulfotransferase-like [Pomacea canaliculata]
MRVCHRKWLICVLLLTAVGSLLLLLLSDIEIMQVTPSRLMTDSTIRRHVYDTERPKHRHSAPDTASHVSGTRCTPRQHVVFWKIHKTGSSTVANILQRYGYIRHLNFVLPRKRLHAASYNYLNKPGEPLTARSLIPPPTASTTTAVEPRHLQQHLHPQHHAARCSLHHHAEAAAAAVCVGL